MKAKKIINNVSVSGVKLKTIKERQRLRRELTDIYQYSF